jgi:hypothetical protein
MLLTICTSCILRNEHWRSNNIGRATELYIAIIGLTIANEILKGRIRVSMWNMLFLLSREIVRDFYNKHEAYFN